MNVSCVIEGKDGRRSSEANGVQHGSSTPLLVSYLDRIILVRQYGNVLQDLLYQLQECR